MRKDHRKLDRAKSKDLAARALAGPIIDWLLGERRLAAGRIAVLLDSFVHRMRDEGLPIDRASLQIQQLHPQLAARSFVWDDETGEAVEMGFRHSARDTVSYTASPVRLIFEGQGAIRQRLEGLTGALGYPILEELLERGYTDYTILPLSFANSVTNAFSVATRRSGGFTAQELALLDAVLPAFSALIELQQTRRTARDLLDTYVGPNAGERIFSGTIKRGDGEVIDAVLWFCDLRDFTAFSQSEPLDEVIALLNTYFDIMAAPVTAHGGEILKFVGDAMLAIFDRDSEAGGACGAVEAALRAAQDAVDGLAKLNQQRAAVALKPLECGIALHVDDVMYGNIGAAERLDFTVIGPAVNLVCRLEALCADSGHPFLVSSELARMAPERFVSLGRQQLKGIAETREIFAPAKPA